MTSIERLANGWRWAAGVLCAAVLFAQSAQRRAEFQVQLFEDVELLETGWNLEGRKPEIFWTSPHLGVGSVPSKISPAGMPMTRSTPFVVRATGSVTIPAGGSQTLRLRSAMKARLYVDEKLVASTEVPKEIPLTPTQIAEKEAADKQAREEAAKSQADREAREEAALETLAQIGSSKDDKAIKAVQEELDRVRAAEKVSATEPPASMPESQVTLRLMPGPHRIRLEFGGKSLAREVSVVLQPLNGKPHLLSTGTPVGWNAKSWGEWRKSERQRVQAAAAATSAPRLAAWEQTWRQRHQSLQTAYAAGDAAKYKGQSIDTFLDSKLTTTGVNAVRVANDYEFVRRVYLDTWGLIPTSAEVRSFVTDTNPEKRKRLVAKLVQDARWADPWVSYWEDVLAENPVMFGQVPNSTGPFKQWIYRSFLEDRGYDRFATELVLMEGASDPDGTLGFRESMSNDLPPAEKAFVVAQAFMAANMKCARCHDSPVNQFKQRDLFGLAALLEGRPVIVPATSSVGEVPGRRKPAVTVTSKPGDAIAPSFVFDSTKQVPEPGPEGRNTREALASWLSSHPRFAEVGVNRIWKRFFGTALVEPVDNWPRNPRISHPELLAFLAAEFRGSGYSVRHVEQLILNSEAYQRERDQELSGKRDEDGRPLFAAQPMRRMRAEELVDSLHRSTGREFKSEKMAYGGIDFGYPKRTWQLVTLSNEEDNMILVRPRMQEILTAASAFGWRDQRPDPLTVRNDDPTPLQPLTLANGGLMTRLVRLTDASTYTRMAREAVSLDAFSQDLLLSTLGRLPGEKERAWLNRRLGPSWGTRKVDAAGLQQEAHENLQEFQDMMDAYRQIAEARKPEPATKTLTEEFRQALEGVLWVLFNSPEFLFVP